MKRISKQIREGFESITPDILTSILSDCKEAQDDAIPFQEKKTAPLILRIVASAAVLALLVGVGALAGGLFRRPSNLNPTTEETQPPTLSAEDEQLLNAFCEATDMNFDEIKDKAIVRHYWDLGDLQFFYVDNISVYPEKMNSIRLLDKEFIFGTEQPLYMYKNGVCIDFMTSDYNTAFEILTNDSLNAFYHFHKAENETLYDPGNWPAKTDLDCPAHLSAEKRVELEATLGITAFNTDDQWYGNKGPCDYRYYGTYEGYDVVFQQTWQAAVTTKTIAGQAFTHGSSFILYAHKDGNLLMLSDVYEDGLISKESIAAAREYHNQCGMISTCRPYPITQDYEERIEQAWAQISNEPFGTWYSEENPDGDWRVYPGDGYILFYTGGEQEEVFTTLKIGNYSFSHPTTFQMYIYAPCEMRLMELKEYYDQYGEDNYLAEAAAMHIETQNAVFGEDWMTECKHEFQETVILEPSCSNTGNGIHVCQKCGYNVSVEYPVTDHSYEEPQVFISPNCTETGKATITCKWCGYSKSYTIPANGHTWQSTGCHTPGICTVCGIHNPHGAIHNYVLVSEDTYSKYFSGEKVYSCADCGQSYTRHFGKHGEYNFEEIIDVATEYAKSLGFNVIYSNAEAKSVKYSESFHILESNGGHEYLAKKALELVDKQLRKIEEEYGKSPEDYTFWIVVSYVQTFDFGGYFSIYIQTS